MKFLYDQKINQSLGEQSLKSQAKKKKKSIIDNLMIKKDCTWKGGFDLLLLGVSCLSIFGNAYLAAFEVDDSNIYFTIVDLLVEGLFLADIIFNFL